MLFWKRRILYKKSDCYIHAPLEQRLNAVNILRNEHAISILCKVLNVNRSTYYKHFCSPLSKRELENQDIKSKILSIYTSSKKRLGCKKIMVQNFQACQNYQNI